MNGTSKATRQSVPSPAGGAERVEIVGRGLGSVLAAFAGLLHPCRPRVRLLDYLASFDLLCRDPLANWPLSTLARGVLRAFDLPDVYRALGAHLKLGKPAGSRLDPGDMPGDAGLESPPDR